MHKLLAQRREIAAIWSIEDVQVTPPDLSEEQCWQVLQDMDRHHDAELGITGSNLECLAQMFFGAAPDQDD